jgi:hypothetical protein
MRPLWAYVLILEIGTAANMSIYYLTSGVLESSTSVSINLTFNFFRSLNMTMNLNLHLIFSLE